MRNTQAHRGIPLVHEDDVRSNEKKKHHVKLVFFELLISHLNSRELNSYHHFLFLSDFQFMQLLSPYCSKPISHLQIVALSDLPFNERIHESRICIRFGEISSIEPIGFCLLFLPLDKVQCLTSSQRAEPNCSQFLIS